MDNEPPGIISEVSFSFRVRLRRAQPAKVWECIDACRVPTVECDLHRILAHESHVFDAQLVGAQRLESVESPGCATFTTTFSARTCPPQLLTGVTASASVFPGYVHHLPCTVDIDIDRKRIGILQRSYA
jgi:hypothetical protein